MSIEGQRMNDEIPRTNAALEIELAKTVYVVLMAMASQPAIDRHQLRNDLDRLFVQMGIRTGAKPPTFADHLLDALRVADQLSTLEPIDRLRAIQQNANRDAKKGPT